METFAREERRVLPGQLVFDPVYDVRPGGVVDSSLEELAQDIEANGQLDPVIVESRTFAPINQDTFTRGEIVEVADYQEQLVIVAGHRRAQAIGLINIKRTNLDPPEPLLEVLVVVDYSITSPAVGLRKAISSNLQRKNYNPMQVALLIDRVRKENEYHKLSSKHATTKAIADYLNISTASVTQHAKFLRAPDEVKIGLLSGEMTADYALTLLTDVKSEKQAAVVEKSRKIQANKELAKHRKSTIEPEVVVIEESFADENGPSVPTKVDKKPKPSAKPAKPAKIEKSSLDQAIRETPDASDVPIPITRKEIIAFIADIDSPAYGYPDAPARVWSRYMTEKYLPGIGTESAASKKFDAMLDHSLRGDETSRALDEQAAFAAPSKKSASGARAIRKDAGKPKKK